MSFINKTSSFKIYSLHFLNFTFIIILLFTWNWNWKIQKEIHEKPTSTATSTISRAIITTTSEIYKWEINRNWTKINSNSNKPTTEIYEIKNWSRKQINTATIHVKCVIWCDNTYESTTSFFILFKIIIIFFNCD